MPPPGGASDEDYAAFLEKANDTTAASTSTAATAGQSKTKTTVNSVDAEVPAGLKSVSASYTSETDAPFEPVSLSVGSEVAEVDVDVVRRLVGRDDVEGVDMRSFDPRGEYEGVVAAVRKVCDGDVGVFRVGFGGARCEYWVLGIDRKGKRAVGLRALAVES